MKAPPEARELGMGAGREVGTDRRRAGYGSGPKAHGLRKWTEGARLAEYLDR